MYSTKSFTKETLYVNVNKGKARQKNILLVCGILAPVVYIIANIVCALAYAGYNVVNQTVSELSAIGATTRWVWNIFIFIYSGLMIAFAFGLLVSAKKVTALRRVAVLIMITIVIGFFWPPMHQREVLAASGSTLTDKLHIVFTAITVPLMILQIGFGAAAFGSAFRWYSALTLLVLLVAGMVTGYKSTGIEKNLPTPGIGIWERINIGAYMVWIIVLAFATFKKHAGKVLPV